jgi:flavin reductase (DIM6/NTAB) family NADH-FMN oxidoreductase RutF
MNDFPNSHFKNVPLEKAYRLLTHGATVLVSAQHKQQRDVMAAAWACALEFKPAKVTVVLDKSTMTRQIIEQSGYFVLQVPTYKQIDLVYQLGTTSLHDMPNKLEKSGVNLFYLEDSEQPLVADCSAWLVCKLIPEPHNQQAHDLFIGEVISAWADDRIFRDGHWHFQDADPEWRSLHHVAGGNFYLIGEEVSVQDRLKSP